MIKTEKYGLNLPGDNDFVDIDVLNENWKKVDKTLAALSTLAASIKSKSLRVSVEGDVLCFSGGLPDSETAEENLQAASFSNLSFGALPVTDVDTDNWAVTEGDLNVTSDLSEQTAKFVAQTEAKK